MSHGQALQSDLGFNVQAGMWKARVRNLGVRHCDANYRASFAL